MRLIDANALKANLELAEEKEYATTGYILHMCDALQIIDASPTIDAIPLDWLREKMDGYAAKLRSTELAALVTVMQMWEREAR